MILKMVLLFTPLLCIGLTKSDEVKLEVEQILKCVEKFQENTVVYTKLLQESIDSTKDDSIIFPNEIGKHSLDHKSYLNELEKSNLAVLEGDEKKAFQNYLESSMEDFVIIKHALAAKKLGETLNPCVKKWLEKSEKRVIKAISRIQNLLTKKFEEPGFFSKYRNMILLVILALIVVFVALFVCHKSKIFNK